MDAKQRLYIVSSVHHVCVYGGYTAAGITLCSLFNVLFLFQRIFIHCVLCRSYNFQAFDKGYRGREREREKKKMERKSGDRERKRVDKEANERTATKRVRQTYVKHHGNHVYCIVERRTIVPKVKIENSCSVRYTKR